MAVLFFFLFGLVIGSFLNVVIYRLQSDEPLTGRSHCRRCRKPVRWRDNVPLLSFLLLGGRCRDCRAAISPQYPLVELSTGLVFASVGFFVFDPSDRDSWLRSLWYLGLFAALVVVFVYDLSTMYIPMGPLWFAVAWTALFLAVSKWSGPAEAFGLRTFAPELLSAAGAFLFFYALVAVSGETWMGMGDAYFGLLIGLSAGWPGTLWALTLSFGLGAAVGLVLVAFGRKGMKSQVPFAPFLALGLYLTMILPRAFPELNVWLLLF
jgi:leader peptidase (prepilin peptidase)/N-methyltransferase